MSNKEQNMEKVLGSKMKAFEAENTPDLWNEIDSGVKKKLFFQFNYDRVNIYYIGGIPLLALAIYLFLGKQEENNQKINTINQTEYQEKNSAPVIETNKTGTIKESVTTSSQNIKQDNKEVKTKQIDPDNNKGREVFETKNLLADTLSTNPKDTSDQKNLISPSKKIVYIRKRDTIVKTNIIKSKKKRN